MTAIFRFPPGSLGSCKPGDRALAADDGVAANGGSGGRRLGARKLPLPAPRSSSSSSPGGASAMLLLYGNWEGRWCGCGRCGRPTERVCAHRVISFRKI